MRAERFFDAAARARVAEAVKAAEARTTGQIVPVVVEKSVDDRAARIFQPLGAAFLATLVMLGLSSFWPALQQTPRQLFNAAAVVGVLLLVLNQIPAYWRLAHRRQLEIATRRRAMLAFVEHGVFRTRDENGVLLFASIEERKVVVLGDRAVHARLGDAHWQKAVATLVAGIRAGDPAAGFCAAVANIGEEMARAFPRVAPAQANELPDDLQVDR